MIETLAARVKLAAGQTAEALDIYQAALSIFPQHRALTYDYAEALLSKVSAQDALDFINRQLQFDPNDVRLYRLQAQSHEALGNILLQHQALAEVYSRQGNYPAAIEQLQIALKTDDGDFYQMSSVEARLRELRELAANESKKK
jgi:predicted Zn-dependent protease